MRLAAVLVVVVFATSATAQSYDLFYVMPGRTGTKGLEAGISTDDAGSVADVGIVNLAAKYSVTDQFEIGTLIESGLLHDDLSSLSTVTFGVKYGIGEATALSAAFLAPASDADDPALFLGVMKSVTSGDMMFNSWLQLGFLDGNAGAGAMDVDLLVEPTKTFGDKLTGYLDVLVHTNTDDIGDFLAIDLGPNADIMINDSSVVNVGLRLGVAGDAKADDLGISATFIMGL